MLEDTLFHDYFYPLLYLGDGEYIFRVKFLYINMLLNFTCWFYEAVFCVFVAGNIFVNTIQLSLPAHLLYSDYTTFALRHIQLLR